MKSFQLLAGAGLAVVVLAAPAISSASPQIYRSADVLPGDRYDRMRALVDYLDRGTQFMVQESTEAVGYDPRGQSRALLNQLQRLRNDTVAFNTLVDGNRVDSRTLTRQVNTLVRDTRNVSSRIRRVPATRDVWDDWSAVVDGVNRMQRLVAGYDVSVPQPRSEWAYGGYGNGGRYGQDRDRTGRDDHYAYPRTSDVGGYRSDVLTGSRLTEFRRLAHDLDTLAERAHRNAEANGLATEPVRGRFLENLHHFADDTRALHEQSDNDRLLPSDLGPTVSHLLADAREVDRSLRQAGAYQNVWNDWQQVMRTLERMDQIVRR